VAGSTQTNWRAYLSTTAPGGGAISVIRLIHITIDPSEIENALQV
jgi:hypothetical protein